MSYHDHVDYQLNELISDAMDEQYLEEGTPAYGIAMKVMIDGYGDLTDQQKYVFDTYVVKAVRGCQARHDTAIRRELLARDD